MENNTSTIRTATQLRSKLTAQDKTLLELLAAKLRGADELSEELAQTTELYVATLFSCSTMVAATLLDAAGDGVL